MTGQATRSQDGQLRVLFSLLHAGYLRHYGDPIRILAAQGHRVHIALARSEKDKGDNVLLDRLVADSPTVTYSVTPERPYIDGWRRLAWVVRALIDLSRYADPRYATAPALKERIAGKIVTHVQMSRMDILSKRLALRFVDRVMRTADEGAARRHIRAFARIEEAIPPSRRITRFVRTFAPDVVAASPVVEIASFQIDVLKSARRLGVPCVVAIASWDNLTNKGLIRVLPERVIVWNDIQLRELEMHDVPIERGVATGAQKFDKWFERTPSTSREEFMQRVGLDAGRPYVVYLCSSPFIARDEVTFVKRWIEGLRTGPGALLRDAGVLVRPHPQNAAQWAEADLSAYPNVVVWPREGQQPDEGAASEVFFDTLAHSAAVVGVNTTALIEAGIAGKSVFTVTAPEFERTQTGTIHFHYLRWENGGLLHVAESLDEHLEQLEQALERGDEDEPQVRAFVERFCRPHGLDQPAAPLVAAAVVETAALGPLPRGSVSAKALAFRVSLYPLAIATSVVASVVVVARTVKKSVLRVRAGLRSRALVLANRPRAGG